MNTPPMYQADLAVFCSTRAATLSLAEGLTEAQAAFTPAPGKWSAGEILDHILLAEKLYRDKFTQLIALAKAGKKAEISTSFGEIDTSILFIPKAALPLLEVPFRMMNLFIPSAVRETMTRYRLMPAQAPNIAEPRQGRQLAELRKDLASSLQQTVDLFQGHPALDYRQMRLSHPLMGNNSALQTLRIMTLHEQRHQEQIRNVQRSPSYPKTR
jgi:DinB superfamily